MENATFEISKEQNGVAVSCATLVIGGGVIGLAVARALSRLGSVILIERHPRFGVETSSRNSEVIHAGIHYPAQSEKTRLCRRGREMLYAYCAEKNIPFARCGKIVVATSPEETSHLEKLKTHAGALEVKCRWISGAEIADREPLVKATAGLFFAESGIVDSHAFMAALERDCLAAKVTLAYGHRAREFDLSASKPRVLVSGPDGNFVVESEVIVNAAGLAAAEISNLARKENTYAHRFCRGRYFGLSSLYRGRFRHLVYPVPPKDGLGVHVTLDLAGAARLGPDVDWYPDLRYDEVESAYHCDWEALRPSFAAAARRFLPALADGDLSPGLIGVRPKLFVDGTARPDFLLARHENWIHLLGIESPGLTASLAIAEEVSKLRRGII